jgi:CAAX protease family protein
MDADYPMSIFVWNGVFLSGACAAAFASRRTVDLLWLAMSFVLFNMNLALVLNLFDLNGALYALARAPEVRFNWAGKIAAFAFSLAVLALGVADRRASGVTLRQSASSYVGWIVVAVLCATEVAVALQIDNEPQTAETIAYQLTVPSLEEEIFYRGIFLFALTKAFGEGPRFLFANAGWGAVLSATMFAVLHSLFWTSGGLFCSAEDFLFAGFFGVVLTWLRLNTGSIAAPMLLHSVVNTVWRIV